jgi:hypothetical protein
MNEIDDILDGVKVPDRKIKLDPTVEIEEVTPSLMMNDDAPGTGNPAVEGWRPEQLVCPEDACHWQPCQACDPTRWKCDYPARHPIHLTSRLLYVYNKTPDESIATGYKWVADPCKCHPARQADGVS